MTLRVDHLIPSPGLARRERNAFPDLRRELAPRDRPVTDAAADDELRDPHPADVTSKGVRGHIAAFLLRARRTAAFALIRMDTSGCVLDGRRAGTRAGSGGVDRGPVRGSQARGATCGCPHRKAGARTRIPTTIFVSHRTACASSSRAPASKFRTFARWADSSTTWPTGSSCCRSCCSRRPFGPG